MRRRVMFSVVPIVVLLAACGSSGEANPSTSTPATPLTPVTGSPTVAPSSTLPDVPVPATNPAPETSAAPVPTDPPVTLPVGSSIAPGSIDSTTLSDLTSACADAVTPMRELMERYESGLVITSEEDNTALNDALRSARDGCGEEFTRFYNDEVLGWLNGAVSTDG